MNFLKEGSQSPQTNDIRVPKDLDATSETHCINFDESLKPQGGDTLVSHVSIDSSFGEDGYVGSMRGKEFKEDSSKIMTGPLLLCSN